MRFDDVRRHFVFYICPRPVVLVTAQAESGSNLFPMDLISPLAGDYFALALRTTGPSVHTMAAARRIVISDAPFAMKELVYALGRQHRVATLDWTALPFTLRRSPEFDFPIPQFALRVRELEVVHVQEIGSHTLFLTRLRTQARLAIGLQLFHVHEYYFQSRLRAPRQQTRASVNDRIHPRLSLAHSPLSTRR